MWIVSFVSYPGIQRLREQDPGQILWNWLHKTESNRRQQAPGSHSRGGREDRAVQAGVSVYLCVGDPWQTSVGGDLHQRQYTQCKCADWKLCAWFNLPHEVTFFSPPSLTQWRKRRMVQPTIQSLSNTLRVQSVWCALNRVTYSGIKTKRGSAQIC